MLNLVLINSFDEGTLGIMLRDNKLVIIPLLIIFYFLSLLLIGYLDTRFGFRQEEMRNNAMHNPILMDLVKSVEEIKKEVLERSKTS